jgi:hypothetical protein
VSYSAPEACLSSPLVVPWEKREWIKFASDEWPDNAGLEGASIAKNQYLLVEWSGVYHVEHFSSDL